jgi:uncharacterized protein
MKKIAVIFLFLFTGLIAFSQTAFNPKNLLTARIGKQELVNDFSNILTADQKQTLENKLDRFDDSTSTQIAVVIIPSLGDYDIADYNVQLGRAWGVGNKPHNNGVVLLICTDPDNHKLNISTGYGAEGALPDITCSEIIDDIIVPNFKGHDYYAGIDLGTNAIIQAMKGEYKAPPGYRKNGGSSSGLIVLIIVIVLFIIVVSSNRGGGSGGSFGSGGFFPFLLGSMLGGGFGGGGGRSSDSGGGGFGGFGGGSFGGGGASGSW